MQLLQQLTQTVKRSDGRHEERFFTMRLLFNEGVDCEDVDPIHFKTHHLTTFEMRGNNESRTHGPVTTPFAGFRLTSEANVTVFAA